MAAARDADRPAPSRPRIASLRHRAAGRHGPHRASRAVPARRHRPAAVGAPVEELPERRRRLRRARQFPHLFHDADAGRLAVQQRLGGGADDGHRHPPRLPLRLCADAQPHAGEGLVLCAGAAARLRALAAVGDLADLHLRQPGLPAAGAVRAARSTARSASCWPRCSTPSRTPCSSS